MSKIYEFTITRKLSIVLALCCGLAAVLLFVAGAMSGFLLSPHYMAQTTPKPTAPEAKLEASAKLPSAAKPEAATTQASPACGTPAQAPINASAQSASAAASPNSAPPQPPSAASAAGASSAVKAEAGALAATSEPGSSRATSAVVSNETDTAGGEQVGTPVKAAVASAPDTYPVSLAVQVGSFTVEDNANRLAKSLQQLGYPAEIVQRIDSRQRIWYVVRLGPYHKWDTASGVALRLASNEDLKPVVGPM